MTISAPASTREVSDNMDNVLSIILGGGRGTRLEPLTKKRAKPAVPLGANYRLIDIPVSNCINSDINKIYCLTQFNSASLNRHLAQAYNASIGSYTKTGFVEVLAAQQSAQDKDQTEEKKLSWFQGTADAVRKYQWIFNSSSCDEYLILSGDHLYRMDYRPFIMKHREVGADITVSAVPMDEERAEAFGLMKIDDTGRITDFAEKPRGDALKAMRCDTTILGLDANKAKEMPYIASMGIYVFSAKVMEDLLMIHCKEQNDFGGEIIPYAKDMGMHVQAFLYDGYWEDIGTIKAFYNANLQCNKENPQFSFYEAKAPIYTSSRFLPPTKILDSAITQSTIGDGCFIEKSSVMNTMVGLRSHISEGCVIEDTLMLGADFYENKEVCASKDDCFMPLGVGPGTTIKKAIIDKNARIGANCSITNKDNVQEDFEHIDDGWVIKDYIVVIEKDCTIPDGTVI